MRHGHATAELSADDCIPKDYSMAKTSAVSILMTYLPFCNISSCWRVATFPETFSQRRQNDGVILIGSVTSNSVYFTQEFFFSKVIGSLCYVAEIF